MSKKLYEILAIEKDAAAKASAAIKEAGSLFGDQNNYLGIDSHYVKLVEDKPDLPNEGRFLSHTVDETLRNIEVEVGGYIDITLQKEMSNTTTEADVIVDGAVFFPKMSATALLNLEARLEELIRLYKTIPTLTHGEEWKKDETTGQYVSAQREQLRTEKQNKVIVLYEATKEHPAQTQLATVDTPVYKVERTVFSGMLTPADKKLRVARLEKIQQAVKQARQRANAVEIVPLKIADRLFEYVNK